MIWMNKKLRDMREEDGFTLIELMVVVLIIAILIAIAIPTFLGARGRAQDRAAQSNARNVVTNAKAIFTDAENYAVATVAELNAAEPTITTIAAGTDSDPATNSVSVVSGNAVGGKDKAFYSAVMSESTRCYFLRSSEHPSVAPVGLRWLKVTDGAPTCNATNAAAAGNWAASTRSPGDAPESA
jgi:type IV pilus assembly protein PilA